MGMDYKINEGDGAFYGPKIDFHIRDSLGRDWQCATVQLDFAMPERFDLKYMGEDGTDNHQPVMLHRVIYGSMERFLGILIEHYGGKFPLWLSPRQVRVLTVSDEQKEYAQEIYNKLFDAGFEVELDDRTETIGRKVREAEMMKVRYIVVVGNKEVEKKTITIRDGYTNKIVGTKKISEFINDLKDKIEKKEV